MNEEDYFIEHDLPINWGYQPLPLCSLRTNVPRIPKHSEPVNMSRLPSNIQTCRRVLHLEIDKNDQELVSHLVKYSKKSGLYTQWWGSHARPTEGVDWQSPPGDIRRAAKFAVKTTNYNASMTIIDVFGFLDLNNVVHAKKRMGPSSGLSQEGNASPLFSNFKTLPPSLQRATNRFPLAPYPLSIPISQKGKNSSQGLPNKLRPFPWVTSPIKRWMPPLSKIF